MDGVLGGPATELDHIGVAVTDLTQALPRWKALTGEPSEAAELVELVESQGVRVAFLRSGTVDVELLEPLAPGSTVGRFIERRGEGLHHLAFRVPNVDAALADLLRRGEKVVDKVGRPGARGHRIGFAHPTAYGGVLVEFVEAP